VKRRVFRLLRQAAQRADIRRRQRIHDTLTLEANRRALQLEVARQRRGI
jgi:hypothetical protein